MIVDIHRVVCPSAIFQWQRIATIYFSVISRVSQSREKFCGKTVWLWYPIIAAKLTARQNRRELHFLPKMRIACEHGHAAKSATQITVRISFTGFGICVLVATEKFVKRFACHAGCLKISSLLTGNVHCQLGMASNHKSCFWYEFDLISRLISFEIITMILKKESFSPFFFTLD